MAEKAKVFCKLKDRTIEVKVIFSDFDGVMTNNKVLIDERGNEWVSVSRADGLGIRLLKESFIDVIILSTEPSKAIEARAKKLGIPSLIGINDKAKKMQEYCIEHHYSLETVMFIGNDINDFSAMKCAAIAVVPSDAHPSVGAIADIHLDTKGGAGVLRELADLLLFQNK